MLVFGRTTKFGSFEKVKLLEGALISDEKLTTIHPFSSISPGNGLLMVSNPRSLLIIGSVLKMSAIFFSPYFNDQKSKNEQLR